MTIDQLRRDATVLKRAYSGQHPDALLRVAAHRPRPDGVALKHADFLHVIARERGFASWPHLKVSVETQGMDRAQRQQRLALALKNRQDHVVRQMLDTDPSLPEGNLALSLLIYDRAAVAQMIVEDPSRATAPAPLIPPLTVLAQSTAIHLFPDREGEMLAIADLLLANGADVNHGVPEEDGHALSTLYFAMGHANNMALSEWLLDHGADPNDGESLYHATELGHHGGLRLLLAHGADPRGSNALLRAMDFHDVDAVQMLLDAGARADDFNPEEVGGEAPWTVPALHQAARRMSPPEMVTLLLDNGADPQRIYDGVTPYAYARIFGNTALAQQLEAAGHATPLTEVEALLAEVADGVVPEGRYIDPAKLPPAARNIIRDILHLPGKLPHVQRLVAVGVEYDRPDASGVTPVQAAGWSGLPDVMATFLHLKPDLAHINSYGGTLFSTILHGAENNPDREGRDYIACLRLALEHGVALPRAVPDRVGDPEIAAFLRDWAEAKPGQVVENGPV
ncbi:ankyrin repeat domain-containing protein [Rhodobacteraceae bacterium N5(2021)]|uniref:Ankyrin repeat domain-containing protein n=1 Tax=Gymnodinialimonas phycosphaerae TaxID=2841589 RepID=A0A975TZ60_9RHOB|nr:ankyrin repeat domain-containing protein [Gymnodinialimonas phycosphaerae]MBY4893738.1 ankyrin repeat domain-containing protein [Gymnodinialimonas phycosphaerae]